MVPVMQEAAAQADGRIMQAMRKAFGQMEILAEEQLEPAAEEQLEPAADVWEGLLLVIGTYQYYQYHFQ